MLNIIHSTGIKKVLDLKQKDKASCSFIILTESLRNYGELLRLAGLQEIIIEDVSEEERRLCEKEYIQSIAELSSVYNSVEWWAAPLSEKNEHISFLYRNLYLFYSLIKTLSRFLKSDISVFVICEYRILKQLKTYCCQNNIRIRSLDKTAVLFLKNEHKKFLMPLKAVLFVATILLRKITLLNRLKAGVRKEISGIQNYYVIRTWIDARFQADGEKYNDTFFGKLPEHALRNGYKVILLANIAGNYLEITRKTDKVRRFLIIPEEFFFKYPDFFGLLFFLFFKKPELKDRVLFNRLDATELYKDELSEICSSSEYLKNIFRYFVGRRFAELVDFKVYIQPFENYAWEKTTISGIREAGRKGEVLGFQHAFVTRNSFKYFPGESEAELMPMPDRIITRGKITKNIMERYGHYKPGVLKAGCALRQEYLSNITPFKRRRFKKVVVPLTMVQHESAAVMQFLFDAGLPGTDLKVVIRCHPAAPFRTFRKYINFSLPDNFIISNEKNVQEELSTTDIVLYTWTTVAVEALKLGLPVIYLDILTPMYVDPLFECASLKRTVGRPEELLPAVQAIYDMDDSDFYREQVSAQKYLSDDFYPVTEENLIPFMPYNNLS